MQEITRRASLHYHWVWFEQQAHYMKSGEQKFLFSEKNTITAWDMRRLLGTLYDDAKEIIILNIVCEMEHA